LALKYTGILLDNSQGTGILPKLWEKLNAASGESFQFLPRSMVSLPAAELP
jgi:hypothetical protein